MRKLQDQLVRNNQRPTGFDYMRLVLAVSVLFWHTIATSLGHEAGVDAFDSWVRSLVTSILPMFFALSGFLVAGSLERSATVASFLWLRFIRIFPALSVEVLLSALVLGPIFTSLALDRYFVGSEFASYFWNLIGYVHYTLPGVFLSNPYEAVINGQLWTVPYELECYIALAGLAIIGGYKTKWLWAALLIALSLFFASFAFEDVVYFYKVPGRLLVFFFLCGVAAYRFRNVIPYHPGLGLISVVLTYVLFAIPGGMFFAVIPATYLTIILGLANPKLPALLKTGDYSYGLFLYHFPIQQAIVATFDWAQNPYLNALASLAVTLPFAVLSWHLVEKHALKGRALVTKLDALSQWLMSLGRKPPMTSAGS